MGRRLQLPSGRVIALGRAMLACLYLVAIWVELGPGSLQRSQAITLTTLYLCFAAGILAACWNSWWNDAKLAGPAHGVDVLSFTLLVLLTEGYNSPYFSFFMFLLLAAAIRWGWRATALTAALVAILYPAAAVFAARGAATIDIDHFVVRIGNMLILSLILIWFGIQWRPGFSARDKDLLDQAAVAGKPLEGGLAASMAALRAGAGAFAWRGQNSEHFHVAWSRQGEAVRATLDCIDSAAKVPFLYDLPRERCLWRDSSRSLRSCPASETLPADVADALRLHRGIAIPIKSGTGQGMLFLEEVPALSTDHLDLGAQIGEEISTAMEQRALLRAAEDGAAARSRLALARDLHDSVVQFLAGAAFRLEAVRRAEAAGGEVGPAVDELKQLMLEEQGELRAFVAALRSGSRVPLDEVAKDVDLLVNRLSKQWRIECVFSSQTGDATVPTRIHLDTQQLVREAVANAVRHAGARNVRIRLAAPADELLLEFVNDGAAYPRTKEGGRMPRSLKERVEEAGGTLELSRGMGVTKLSIALPIGAFP